MNNAWFLDLKINLILNTFACTRCYKFLLRIVLLFNVLDNHFYKMKDIDRLVLSNILFYSVHDIKSLIFV